MVRFLILAGLIALSAGCQPRVQAPEQQCECTNCPCDDCENDAAKCAPKEARGWPVPDPTEFTPFVDFHFHDDHASDRRFYVTKETSKKIMEQVRLKSLTPIDKYDASGKPYIEFETSEHIEHPAGLAETLRQKGERRILSVGLRYSDWTSEEICVERDKFEEVRKIIGADYAEPDSNDTETRLRNGEQVVHPDGTTEEIVPFAQMDHHGVVTPVPLRTIRVDVNTGEIEVLQDDGTWEKDDKTDGAKPDVNLLRESLRKDAERRHDPPPRLGGYSPDENGVAAYLRDMKAWDERNPVPFAPAGTNPPPTADQHYNGERYAD